MHPFLSSYKTLLTIALLWLVISGLISQLAGQVALLPGTDNLLERSLLFIPWYMLLLFFCFSNFYICNWLPLSQTSPLRLLSVQLSAMITTLALWFLLGNWWSSLLVDSGFLETATQFKKAQFLNVIISASLYLIWMLLHYVYIQATHIEIENSQLLEKKLLISQVELQTIKASVHPHFMYNSLGLLANLALIEPEKVHIICVQMADFLRYSVNYANREWVTLGEEIDHINNYLNIERERFGNRLQVYLQLADELRELHVIPVILFPLIENCIKHGISTTTDEGFIRIEIQRIQEQIAITISNSLDPESATTVSTRLGLKSLKKRLSASYGAAAKLTTQTSPKQFNVTLTLPISGDNKTIAVK